MQTNSWPSSSLTANVIGRPTSLEGRITAQRQQLAPALLPFQPVICPLAFPQGHNVLDIVGGDDF
jgi:hypothetical protein